jgi:hypothetical protein
MYSSQPEESTTTGSEAVCAVTVGIFPLEAFGDAAKIFDGVRAVKADSAIEDIDLKFLAGLESEFAANVFGDYDLKFWGNLDGDHGVGLLRICYRC